MTKIETRNFYVTKKNDLEPRLEKLEAELELANDKYEMLIEISEGKNGAINYFSKESREILKADTRESNDIVGNLKSEIRSTKLTIEYCKKIIQYIDH